MMTANEVMDICALGAFPAAAGALKKLHGRKGMGGAEDYGGDDGSVRRIVGAE